MNTLLYISNIAGKRMAYNFSGSAIEAAHELNLNFLSVANRSASTEEDIKADEQKYNVQLLHIDLTRSPLSLQNYKAYKQLVKIIKDNNIDYIHCNTPVGGLLGRLAGRKCKVKKIIYQAHGFHFYKGAALVNWFIYYPIERWLAHYTDALITINREDYEAAKKMSLHKHGKVYFVRGVGIDTTLFSSSATHRQAKRTELGIDPDDFVIVSVGRLDANKNNKTLVEAISKCDNFKVKLLICGDGEQRNELETLVKKLSIKDQVLFLGNRNDMRQIYNAADALAMASFREGLSRTIMEAMASGLPCIVSKIRGNVDLVEDSVNGFLCDPMDVDTFVQAIKQLTENSMLCSEMSKSNLQKIKEYDISVVKNELLDIYKQCFDATV